MFGIFNRFRKPADYIVIARYRDGHWFKQFTVSAYDTYEAARKFDTGDYSRWTRVSGATLKNPLGA